MSLQSSISIPNFLKEREPALFEELSQFRNRLGERLLDMIDDSSLHSGTRSRTTLPLDELRAVVGVLSVLNKNSWTEQDLNKFDACWRDAMRSDLFGDEFESSRFRIQQAIETGRGKLLQEPAIEQGRLW